MSKKSDGTSSNPRLTACLIAKNEAAFLETCLNSLKGVVDEIVLVDTGSTDQTIEIAKAHGVKIGTTTWTNDFAAARNESLKLATGDWVLWIDADEQLTKESKKAIRQALTQTQFAGFTIPIVNFTADTNDAEQVVHAPVRLFQLKPTTQFTGKIHEQVTPSLEALNLPIGHLEDAKILHEGYRPVHMQARNKIERTVELLQSEVEANPNSSFQWFNLANAYLLAGRFSEAERACRMSIGRLTGKEIHTKTVHQILIEAIDAQGRPEDALEASEATLLAGFGSITTFFSRANIFFKLGQYDEALDAIGKCLKLQWTADLQGDYSISTFKKHVLHGQILGALGKNDKAMTALKKAIAIAPDCAEAKLCVAAFEERNKEFSDALALYKELATGPLATFAQVGIGRCEEGLGDLSKAIDTFSKTFEETRYNEAWICWVRCAEEAGFQAEVLRAYEAAASVYEPNVDILINWGRALEANGDPERALACFSEALKRDDQNPNAYFNCGDLLYRLHLYSDAAHLYESGLRLSPLHPEGWFVLGNSLAHLGLVDGARLAYRQCLALAPEHSSAKNNIEILQEAFPAAS